VYRPRELEFRFESSCESNLIPTGLTSYSENFGGIPPSF
jgi:hypothetical protein